MYENQKNVHSIEVDDTYIELGNAIILQAVKDYRRALKKLEKFPEDYMARRTKREVERFFRGSFFSAITNLHPEVLIKKLNDEVENYA
ncbi:hypothetical protein [Acetobacterium wieringae]|uniref:Uncharacterized protein n=1 Tax=Acetobacterium wieringae TaxID=52694 RepID=A0A1F2PD75_9FIRM|nr:hypothetical protein [Acetobacterium wieringae]OFV69203.1 hypothetical protein ACWI_33970 [Acetobacterium wieringae]